MPRNKKLALNSGIQQTYQVLTKDDEVCIPSLSSILLAALQYRVATSPYAVCTSTTINDILWDNFFYSHTWLVSPSISQSLWENKGAPENLIAQFCSVIHHHVYESDEIIIIIRKLCCSAPRTNCSRTLWGKSV